MYVCTHMCGSCVHLHHPEVATGVPNTSGISKCNSTNGIYDMHVTFSPSGRLNFPGSYLIEKGTSLEYNKFERRDESLMENAPLLILILPIKSSSKSCKALRIQRSF